MKNTNSFIGRNLIDIPAFIREYNKLFAIDSSYFSNNEEYAHELARNEKNIELREYIELFINESGATQDHSDIIQLVRGIEKFDLEMAIFNEETSGAMIVQTFLSLVAYSEDTLGLNSDIIVAILEKDSSERTLDAVNSWISDLDIQEFITGYNDFINTDIYSLYQKDEENYPHNLDIMNIKLESLIVSLINSNGELAQNNGKIIELIKGIENFDLGMNLILDKEAEENAHPTHAVIISTFLDWAASTEDKDGFNLDIISAIIETHYSKEILEAINPWMHSVKIWDIGEASTFIDLVRETIGDTDQTAYFGKLDATEDHAHFILPLELMGFDCD